MGRPSKSLISRERAASAALSVIDTQGLDKLSLEHVARRLGVKAPSLYYHFKDKNELLAEVALILLRDIDPPKIDENDWEKTLIRLCKAARRAILRHPNAAPLLLQFFPRRLLLGAYDFWISMCPYPPEAHMAIIEGTEKLTYASALFEAAARSYGVEPMPDFDLEQFPNLTKAVQANPYDDEEMFEEAVAAFLRGFRHLPKTPKSLTEDEKKRARRLGIAKSVPAPSRSPAG
ncbi:MAG: TetR family transcriptional regulator [Rhizobiales bacterium]|nr:TetR family transcriptional regulator [Hyphomicrobiales bacterium]|tara:strand:+ start:246 stop:944 length:699 start_codon:yes stop_codon:yes gene_type:complete